MTDLEKLLAVVNGLDPDKRTKEEDPPTDEELQTAREGLMEALNNAAKGDEPDIEAARTIRSAIDQIDAEKVTRHEAREKVRAEAAELLKGLEASDADENDETPSADENKPDDENDEPKATAEPEKVPVAASLLESALRKSDRRRVERVQETPFNNVIVSSIGVAQGAGLGSDASIDDVASLFSQFAGQVKRGSQVLLHMDKVYPHERQLQQSAADNTRLIDAITSPRAVTAAGGICEPLPADFNHPICGDRGRPIRDALPAFRADRGGIRFAPSATVDDLEGGITVWTHETDAAPGSDTKACPRVECEDELSAQVDAIVACLTVGNFQARFNSEFWRSRLDLLMVAHDRIAEQTIYAELVANATTTLVPVGAGDGTITDVLRVVDMQVAGIRDRHRLLGTQFVTILPANLRSAMRTQLANQAPAGSADLFDIGEARLAQFFASRGTRPVWSPDIELIGAQTGGAALAAYNTPINVLTFPEGTFLFLDGGTLDLGTNIVDSTLNATNDRQAFMETFEGVVKRGCEALVTPVAIAPDCICA